MGQQVEGASTRCHMHHQEAVISQRGVKKTWHKRKTILVLQVRSKCLTLKARSPSAEKITPQDDPLPLSFSLQNDGHYFGFNCMRREGGPELWKTFNGGCKSCWKAEDNKGCPHVTTMCLQTEENPVTHQLWSPDLSPLHSDFP